MLEILTILTMRISNVSERNRKREMGTGYRRSIRSARLSIGWHAKDCRQLLFLALAVSECRHVLTPSLYSIAHPTQGPTTLWLKHVFSLSLISGPNTRHPARFRTGAAFRLYDDENNGLFSSPSPPGTKMFEKKQNRRARKKGRRGKERRGIDPRRKAPAWSGDFFLIRRCYGNFIDN